MSEIEVKKPSKEEIEKTLGNTKHYPSKESINMLKQSNEQVRAWKELIKKQVWST
jgi:hypothetical protein